MSEIEDDENTEPVIHVSLFICLSPFDSFMLPSRNLLHLISRLEIQSLHPSSSILK